MPNLVLVGTASIQGYVFRSNRLRENLGGSGLVRLVSAWWTELQGRQSLKETGGRLVYQGGGNALLIFPDHDSAKAAMRSWSGDLLTRAPGLRAVVVSIPFASGSLSDAFEQGLEQLTEEENRPQQGFELGALPWVRTCPSTGWAASEKAELIENADDDGVEDPNQEEGEEQSQVPVWLSAEAQAKRLYYHQIGRYRAAQKYSKVLRGVQKFRFPRELNLLGTTEGASQVALVHADGNGIGDWIRKQTQTSRTSDNAFEDSLVLASRTLTHLADTVFARLMEEARDQLSQLEKEPKTKLKLREVHGRKGEKYFPLRPIVDDGDDLTFICHGRLGLSLAARYLQLYEEKAHQQGLPLSACAGVLIMPQKFPFAQAYDLVEQLCGNAKWSARKFGGSWLDCHVQMEGRTLSLQEARQRYPEDWNQTSSGVKRPRFPRRPWCVSGQHSPKWSDFTTAWGTVNAWPRSESKRLFEAFADGRIEAAAVYQRLGSKRSPLQLDGWEEYGFDSLELLDHYWPLEVSH